MVLKKTVSRETSTTQSGATAAAANFCSNPAQDIYCTSSVFSLLYLSNKGENDLPKYIYQCINHLQFYDMIAYDKCYQTNQKECLFPNQITNHPQ